MTRAEFEKCIQIKEIQFEDIEALRLWKNEHKNYFFHKEDITNEQQEKWFKKYEGNANDHMFVVLYNGQRVGCMGFRKLEKEVDAYNIIKGDGNLPKGSMSFAFHMMLNQAYKLYGLPIRLRVLKNNPALNWYLNNQFVILSEEYDYFLMQYKLL